MADEIELLGVKGLRLPGTKERPCPGFPVNLFRLSLDVLAQKAATAASWWHADESDEACTVSNAIFQSQLWQSVFESACERMRA